MARTQRRRAARAAHQVDGDAVQAKAIAGAARVLAEEEWTSLTETLDGLLRLEFPSPFTDLKLLCPKEAWLVVDLSRVRASAGIAPNLRHQMIRVLDCLARLLVHAEMLRPWRDLLEDFWRRVFTSEMLQDVDNDEAMIRGFVRYVRAKGSHVALQWSGRSLEPSQLIEPLRRWLETEINLPVAQYLPVQIGMRFENCQLTHKNLKEIQKLLQVPVTASEKRLLCSSLNLQELSLSSNILPVHVLRELASMLEDPCVRRIDGLNLNSTVPDQAQQPPSYGPALGRVIAAVVTKASDAQVEEPGVFLSLEDCTIYHAAHIDALTAALSAATRPLRGLSVACWQFPDRELFVRFGRLLLTHLPTATDEFDLNVSCIRCPCDPFIMEERLIAARTQVIQEALAARKAVSCRPLASASFYPDNDNQPDDGQDDPQEEQAEEQPDDQPEDRLEDHPGNELDEIKLSTTTFYNVRGILDCGCCRSIVPVDGEELIGNIEPMHLANVRIEGSPGPSGLIVDRCTRHHEGDTMFMPEAAVFCDRLKRLSMRGMRWGSDQFSSWGSILEELNVEGCSHDYGELMRDVSRVAAPSLQVFNVSNCSLDASSFETLLAFPLLRSLAFAHNKVAARSRFYVSETEDHPGLNALLRALRSSGMLELVDIRRSGYDPEDETHAVFQAQITDLLDHERLSVDARRAFLRALQHVPVKLSSDVVATILSFANTGAPRQVIW